MTGVILSMTENYILFLCKGTFLCLNSCDTIIIIIFIPVYLFDI